MPSCVKAGSKASLTGKRHCHLCTGAVMLRNGIQKKSKGVGK
jgi:hypothetical protein